MNQSQQIIESLSEQGKFSVGDEVKVDLSHRSVAGQRKSAPPWWKSLNAEIKAGGGTVFVVGIADGGLVRVVGKKGGRGSTMLGPVGVPEEALTKVG